ncbi:MAG: DUF896 domain-containing protein [Oscillospiraceae bacterium]
MDKSRIERINELARKAKAEGLTDEEILERDRLRREYVAAFRENFDAELEHTLIVDAKGGDERKLKSKAEKQAD